MARGRRKRRAGVRRAGLVLAGIGALAAAPAFGQQYGAPAPGAAAPAPGAAAAPAAPGGATGPAAPETRIPGLPTGIGIPGQVVLPPGGGAPPSFDLRNPNEIIGFQLQLSAQQEEILTDNARGTANGGTLSAGSNGIVTTSGTGKKVGDLISRTTPILTAFDRTPRLEFGLNYSPSYEKFLNAADQDRFDNTLTATGTAQLWQEHLSLSASASVSRQFINNQGAITPGNQFTNNNQTDVETYTVSPVYTQRFGSFATGRLQYLLGSTSSGVLASTLQNTVQASLASGPDFGALFWQGSLLDSESSQGSTPNAGQLINGVVTPTASANTSQRTAQLSSAYALNHTVSLLSGIGYDDIENGTLGGNIKGPFGDFGIGLAGSRLSLTLLYNLRYNGQFASAQGSYAITPRLLLSGSYNESITTTQNQLINNTAGLGLTPTGNFINSATQQNFNPVNSSFGINSGLGNSIFHEKLGQLALNGTHDRNVYALTLQTETRTSGTANFNESDVTITGSYDREISPSTHYNLSLGFIATDQRSPASTSTDTYNATTGFTYKLAETVTATASYSFIYRTSSQAGQTTSDNQLLLGLRKDF